MSVEQWTAARAIRTDKDTHFTGALAQNAKEDENVSTPFSRGWIRAIRITSKENLAWEVQWFRTDGFDDADYDLDTYGGHYAFAAASGLQVAGAGPYYYDVNDLAIHYVDADVTGVTSASAEMHLRLVNRSASAKTAGTDGEVVVEMDFIPV